MAATVTGAFAVIDRASRPIRQIRDSAIEADVAVKRLGASLDELGTQRQIQMLSNTGEKIRSLGSDTDSAAEDAERLSKHLEDVGAPNLARNIDTTNRSIQNTSSVTRSAERDVKAMHEEMDVLGKRTEKTGSLLDRLSAKLPGLRAGLMGMLVPMIGLAAQGIGGLLAGLTSLLPKFADLAGLAGPLGIAFTGMGAAVLTGKLAFEGLSKAMSGNKKAIAELTPEGRQLVQTLKLYKPVLTEIQRSAQQGLFPGLDQSIRQLASVRPVLQQITRGMGSALGGVAANLSGQISSPGFINDFQEIVSGGQRSATQFGAALGNMMNVVRNFLAAALPFTDWLGNTVVGLTASAARTTEMARETGKLSDMFDRTERSVSTFGSVLHNVWDIFRAIGHASRETGDTIWESIDRTTKGWAAFLQGSQGQRDMLSYFTAMRPVFADASHFLGDLVKSLGELSVGGGFTKAINALDEALPTLTKGLGELSSGIGVELVEGLANVVTLLGTLTGGQGPVSMFLRLLNGVLRTINGITHAVPALGTLLGAAFTVVGLNAFAGKLSSLGGPIGSLAAKWRGVAVEANGAAAAEERAAGAARAGGLGGGVVPVGGAAAEEGSLRNSMAGLKLTGTAALVAGAKAVPGMALGALGSLAEFAIPLMLINGLLGGFGTQGGVSDRAAGVLGGMTFGLSKLLGGAFNPVHLTAAEASERGRASILSNAATGRTQSARLSTGETRSFAGAKLPGFNAATGAFTGQGLNSRIAGNQTFTLRAAQKGDEQQLAHPGNMSGVAQSFTRGQLAATSEILHDYERFQEEQVQKARDAGTRMAQGFSQAYNIYSRAKGPQQAFKLTANEMLGDISHLGRNGRTAMAEGVLSWARELERSEPKLRGPINSMLRSMESRFDDLGQHIRIVNGEIFTGSAAKWKEIGEAIESPAFKAEYRVRGAFSGIFKAAVAQLETMGYTGAEAKAMMKNVAHGTSKTSEFSTADAKQNQATSALILPASGKHKGKARGGRLMGEGLHDSVPLFMGMAAPGELIVNRHTESRINRKLRPYGTSLGHEVERENWPHSAPMFQTGGFVAGPGTNYSVGEEPALASALNRLGHYLHRTLTGISGYRSPAHSVAVGGFADDPHTEGRASDTIGTETVPESVLEKFGITRPFPGAAEADHMQLLHSVARGGLAAGAVAASAGGVGGGLAQSIKLRRASLGAGAPGILAATAYNSIARGMEQRINSSLGGSGGGMIPGGHGGGGSPSANERLGRTMMVASGWPASQWPYLQKLWTQESGWNANSVNSSSGAYGIPQALGHGHPFALGDARAQISWGLNYIRGRYGSPSGAWAHETSNNWYGLGGRPAWGGWNQRGGRGTFNRATLLGLGEGHNAEHVNITPHEERAGSVNSAGGKGGGGARAVITFGPGSIVVHGTDRKAADEMVERVMEKLAEALENMGLESEIGVSQ
jgi:hypothetical protein